MRLTRRGVIAQRKSGGFVWAVYTLAMGVDESAGGTSGSVSLSSSRYKQVAKSYTVSSSGTVSLVNSTRTTAANMAVGDYLVNVSTSSNTSTTGTTLYKITAISGTSTRKITYTAYTPSLCAKGEDTGERVESADGTSYPHNGAQGGYWYVLLRGWTMACIWDVFNIKTTTSTVYEEKVTDFATIRNISLANATNVYYITDANYTFSTSNGKYTLQSPTKVSRHSFVSADVWGEARYFMVDKYTDTTMYSNITDAEVSTVYFKRIHESTSSKKTVESKGTATGETVQSVDENAYPQNGAQDGYWYVYGGTKEVYIDNT